MSEQAVMTEAARLNPETDEIFALSCDLTLPLVLDLDGTLVTTDTLHEALFLLLKREWQGPGGFRCGRCRDAPSSSRSSPNS